MAERTLTERVAEAAACDDLVRRMDQAATVRRHRRRHLAPHLIAASLLAAGFTAELIALLTGSAALVAAVVAVLTFGAVAIASAPKIRASIPARWRRRALVAGLSAATWLTLATLGVGWDMVAALLVGEYALAAGWWRAHRLPHYTAVTPAPGEAPTVAEVAEPAGLVVFETRFAERVATHTAKGIPGGVLSGGRDEDGIYSWALDLVGGMTLADVQARTGGIASLIRLPASALAFDPWPVDLGQLGDDSRIRMQILTSSPVIDAVDYEVPRATGGRVPLGPWADGRGLAELTILTKSGIRHVAIVGSTDGGKSVAINGIVASVRANWPTVTLTIDPKRNSSPELRKAATVAVLGLDEAEEFTESVERLIEGRGLEFGYNDWNTFQPSVEHPVYLVVLDESDMVFGIKGMGARWGMIAKTGRSLGVLLVTATQYGGTKGYGNDELLRSSLAAGNVLVMRTASNTSDNLIAPGLPPSRFLPQKPGMAYLQAEDSRPTMSLRTSWLRSDREAEPGKASASEVFVRYPDAAPDQVGRVALGALLVPQHEREQATKASLRRKLDAFLVGNFSAVKQDPTLTNAEDTERYGQVIAFPTALVPDSHAGLTSAQQAVYAAMKAGAIRPSEIQRATGWGETHVANQLKALLGLGLVVNPRFGRYFLAGADQGQEDESETA